jgi:AAA+ superfamily predicted ATPase
MKFMAAAKDKTSLDYLSDTTCPTKLEDIPLTAYLRSGYSLIHVITEENDRAVEIIKKAALNVPDLATCAEFAEYKMSVGLTIYQNIECTIESDTDLLPDDFIPAVQFIGESTKPIVAVFHNVRHFMSVPSCVQAVKDAASKARLIGSSIIFVGPYFSLPPELSSSVLPYDLGLPSADDFVTLINSFVNQYKDSLDKIPSRDDIKLAASSAIGMTKLQAEDAISLSIVSCREINPLIIQAEKAQAIKKSDVLDFISNVEPMDNLGGFDVLKDWIRKRKKAFLPGAKEFGLKFPKGILLLGVPGTGKSLTAKCVASYFNLPLIRFDIGKVFRSFVGSSESAIRTALKTAEAVSPIVLSIEELEKSMAGINGTAGDSGTTARVMSTILVWMQECTKPVFVVATANAVELLPPELLRKGRFSEIFGVIEPNFEERKEIWKIHISKVRSSISNFDLDALSLNSEGYTGAEIEGIVEEALFDAFDSNKELSTEFLISATKRVVPQSISSAERINKIRQWMRDRVRFVSTQKAEVKPIKNSKIKKLQVN